MKGAQWSFSRGLAIAAISLPMLFSATSQANDELLKLQEDPNQWVMWGANYSGTRYSSLDQINAKNAKDLQVAWTFSTGVLRGHEGGPLVIGNTMYIHTPFPNKVFAIDMDKQALRWSYEPKQDSSVIAVMCCDTVNRGLAYSDGKIFLQQADTTLVALDEKTGDVVWKVVNGDPKLGATNTNAPLIVKDTIITGISGGNLVCVVILPPTK
ncbi:PQQ-binding-like beta-propeller repeat protein [Enterovibrio sp. Hal110]